MEDEWRLSGGSLKFDTGEKASRTGVEGSLKEIAGGEMRGIRVTGD